MHIHPGHFRRLLSRELNELYISMAIRSFALSIVGIFVPIYLLEAGFPLSAVVIFFLVYVASRFAFAAPAAALAAKYGLKKVMFLSTAMMALYYPLLRYFPQYGLDINMLAVLSGAALTIFWVSYHIDFVKISKRRHVGEEISIVTIAMSLFSFIGPFAGGSAILIFGFEPVFIAAALILALSMVPLLFSEDRHEPFSLSFRNIFAKPAGDFAANLGYGMEVFAGIVWVIIIFLFITSNTASLGFVASVSLFASLLVSYASGKYSDRKPRKLLRLGAIATAIIWLARLLVKNFIQLVAVDAVYGIVRHSASIPFDAITYRKARKKAAEYIVFRESMIALGGVLLLLAVLAAGLQAGIHLAALGSVLMLFF